jgi:HSP20 family protein
MKTLFQPIHSLSGFLHDSAEVALRDRLLGSSDHIGLSTPLQQKGDSFIVSVPVPGLSKEDVCVYTDSRVLFITKKKQANSAEQPGWLKKEFKYSFVLPDGIDVDRIEAKCRHGLLTIKLKKTRSKKSNNVIKVFGDDKGKDSWQLITFWNKIKAKIRPEFVQRRRVKPSQSGMPMNS